MQIDGPGLTAGDQELSDIVHMLDWLMLRLELLQRNQGGRQRFRDNPFVVAGNSLLRHGAASHSWACGTAGSRRQRPGRDQPDSTPALWRSKRAKTRPGRLRRSIASK